MKRLRHLVTRYYSLNKIALILMVALILTGLFKNVGAQTTMTLPEQIEFASPDDDQSLVKYSVQDANAWAFGWYANLMEIKDSEGNQVSDGAIPQAGRVLAYLITTPPAHPGEYIADVMHNTGLAPQAYAQGIGFGALSPVLSIWKAFRNLAYFLFIIIFVVVGFMIMLRAQVDHQVVVNFQMAFPKIALTLILITFSYAIAGFVIDLIYLVTFVVISLLSTFGIISNPGLAQNMIFGQSIIPLAMDLAFSRDLTGASAEAVGNLIADAFSADGFWGDVVSVISSAVAALIIAVAIIIALFRTLFALIMAYVNIIIHVIFGPLHLLLNALPQNNTFGSWLRGLIANAAIFPAVAIFILIGIALAGGSGSSTRYGVNPQINQSGDSTWVAPLLSTGASVVSPLIGLGIILLLPEIVKIVHGVFSFEDRFGLGAIAIGGLQSGVQGVSGIRSSTTNPIMDYINIGRSYEIQQAERNERIKETAAAMGTTLPPTFGRTTVRLGTREQIGQFIAGKLGFKQGGHH